MRDARGLATGTRSDRLCIVQRLLEANFAGGPVVAGGLQTDDIRQFIAEQLDALGTTSYAIAIASTLPAYLRYSASLGDAVQPLFAVITSPAHWSMASLPRGLTPEEVDRLLSSFTPSLPSPRRGYAVVRLALDLGLRGIEISRLQLTDFPPSTVCARRAARSRAPDSGPNPASRGPIHPAYSQSRRTDDSGAKVIGADALITIYASNMQRPPHPPSERRDTARDDADGPRMFARLPTGMRATGLGRSTIYRLVAADTFPAPVHLGRRAVGWRWSDLDRWSESRGSDPP